MAMGSRLCSMQQTAAAATAALLFPCVLPALAFGSFRVPAALQAVADSLCMNRSVQPLGSKQQPGQCEHAPGGTTEWSEKM